MKRFLILMLALILAMSCMFVFASCDSDEKEEEEEIIPNSKPSKAIDALEDAGYEVGDGSTMASFYFGSYADYIEDAIFAVSEDQEDYVYIYYFEDEDSADAAFEALEEFIAEAEDASGEEMDDEYDIYENMIWIGTPDAIEAAQ